MIDWNHVLVTAAGVLATIAAIKTDIQWLKRWTRDHERSDTERFQELQTRLGRIEDRQ